MIHYDSTQVVLDQYLSNTETLLNNLLSKKFSGNAQIKTVSDLGFPHDVIRIAGGFATGAFVNWNSSRPFVPVDTCMNVCSVSFFETNDDIINLFNEEHFDSLKNHLSNGIYTSNFHRGNHFISYLQSRFTGKRYLLLHSSANEYKDNFNGLYPVKGNWFFDRIKTFSDGKSYIRYLEDKDAEVFYNLAQGLYGFNEIRHEFIAHILLGESRLVSNVNHYHHYGMPSPLSIVMGSHILSEGAIVPVLTLPGEPLYMVKYNRVKDSSLLIDATHFLAPHGWGKRHRGTPLMRLDIYKNEFVLDNEVYNIEFGPSLRAHPNLELRDFENPYNNRKDSFFRYLSKMYDFEIIDELDQIASWSKAGIKIW